MRPGHACSCCVERGELRFVLSRGAESGSGRPATVPTAFSILLSTECEMISGFSLKEKSPRTMLAMSRSESKTL
jgi:hypothetical protein